VRVWQWLAAVLGESAQERKRKRRLTLKAPAAPRVRDAVVLPPYPVCSLSVVALSLSPPSTHSLSLLVRGAPSLPPPPSVSLGRHLSLSLGRLIWSEMDESSMYLTNAKGLINLAGQNNCFLNVVIQALWHLRSFRTGFAKWDDHQHTTTDTCVHCALKVRVPSSSWLAL